MIIMKTINKFLNSTKNAMRHISLATAILVFAMTACSPSEDDSHGLGGSLVNMPQDWSVTAVDNDNEVSVRFDPLDEFIDGDKILAVQFSCPEANINFVVKADDNTTSWAGKVYRSGDYILYVAAVTRAGAGTPREIPFTVAKNLLLENLGPDVLPTEVKIDIDATHQETFYKNELYIEENSIITLTGAIASDDAIVNLDFFERQSTTTAKFVGKSGVYSIYWNPVRKNVIIEPIDPIEAPNYYVFTGVGIGYPTTVSSDAIKTAYGAGDGRYTTEWDPGKSIRSRVVMRNIDGDSYQATICINEGAAFKPFSNANWGNDVFKAEDCTFTGSQIFKEKGDWSPNDNLDKDGYYRITLNAATKAVKVEKVDAAGQVVEDNSGGEEPSEPDAPIVSSSFDLTKASNIEIAGETIMSLYHTLEKDAEYTPKGALANALFNIDFFEKTAGGKLKFLGENGDYHLLYNPIRNNVVISADDVEAPNYMFLSGVGLGYPTKVSGTVISSVYPGNGVATMHNWNFDNEYEFIMMRKISDNVYQATVMMPFEKRYWWDAGPYSAFKAYTQKINESANEISAKFFADGGGITGTATAIVAEILDIPDDGNMDVYGQLPSATLRITIDMNAKKMTVNNFTLP